MLKNAQGFITERTTLRVLIFLIIVVVLIALVQYGYIDLSTREERAKKDMKRIQTEIHRYYLANKGQYPERLSQLKNDMSLTIPDTPWGYRYWIDENYIYCYIPHSQRSPSKYAGFKMRLLYRKSNHTEKELENFDFDFARERFIYSPENARFYEQFKKEKEKQHE